MGVVEITPDERRRGRFVEARFVDVPLARIADELGRAADANVVVSRSVADQRVTITLRDIALDGAINAIAVAQGLVARLDGDTGIHVLATAEEVRSDLAAFRTMRTQVFTLLYPNASDVVRVIGDTFGDRVIVSEDDQDDDQTLEELENRFDRFDLIEGRSRGLIGSGGTSVQNFSNDRLRNDRFRNRDSSRGQSFRPEELPELTPEDARMLAEAQAGAEDAAAAAQRFARRFAATYVTAIQRLNRVVVRSSDAQLLQDIGAMIQRLDVPTPLVLLEVRILRVDLSDGLDRSFDLAFQVGDAEGSFGSSELNLSAGVFQVVSDDVQARLQLLQSKGRLTSLASPILLTANGEVSRIFSGEQIPIVTGFTEPQVIVGDGATTTLSATPVTELRDVGTDLLITANINADRTVTLRLLQETSRVNPDGASILVPTGPGFTSQTIDTVQSQSASGTIVARDGLVLAFGGLIEEVESDQREQVPVLGDLPVIGFFFTRESSVISRSELVVLVRPFVLSTPVETDQISRNLLDSLSIHPYRPGEGGRSGDADDWGVFQEQQPPFNRTIFDQFRFHTVPSFNQDASPGGTP
jgi:general secretion pathway protein D